MDCHTDIQRVLIRRQRNLRSLETGGRGISAAHDDLLLTLAVVPIADLAPELNALVDDTGRDLCTRDRVRLLTVQGRVREILCHRRGNLLDCLACEDELHDQCQETQHQQGQEVGSPRARRGYVG